MPVQYTHPTRSSIDNEKKVSMTAGRARYELVVSFDAARATPDSREAVARLVRRYASELDGLLALIDGKSALTLDYLNSSSGPRSVDPYEGQEATQRDAANSDAPAPQLPPGVKGW